MEIMQVPVIHSSLSSDSYWAKGHAALSHTRKPKKHDHADN